MFNLTSGNSFLQSLVQRAGEIKQEELNRLKQKSQPVQLSKYNPTTRAVLALSQTKQPLTQRKIMGSYDNKANESFTYRGFYDRLKQEAANMQMGSDGILAQKNISEASLTPLMSQRYSEDGSKTLVDYLKNKGYTVEFKSIPQTAPWYATQTPINTMEVKDKNGNIVPIPISYTKPNPQEFWKPQVGTYSYDPKLDPNKEYENLYKGLYSNKELGKEYSILNSEISKVQQAIQDRLDQSTNKNSLMSVADMRSLVELKSTLESAIKNRDEYADKVNAKFGTNSNNWYTYNPSRGNEKPSGFDWDWFKQYQKQIKDTLSIYQSEFNKTMDNSQKILNAFEKSKATTVGSISDISNLSLIPETKAKETAKKTEEAVNFGRSLAQQRAQTIASMTEEESKKKSSPVFRTRPA